MSFPFVVVSGLVVLFALALGLFAALVVVYGHLRAHLDTLPRDAEEAAEEAAAQGLPPRIHP